MFDTQKIELKKVIADGLREEIKQLGYNSLTEFYKELVRQGYNGSYSNLRQSIVNGVDRLSFIRDICDHINLSTWEFLEKYVRQYL